jgi:molybdenum cofactor cytidylyltransferase
VHTQPTVVVLAAGSGSRFEGPRHKLEQMLGARSVLATTIGQVIASGLPLIVVTTSALADSVRDLVASRDIVLLPEVGTPGFDLGMGHSIVAGVSARPNARGWIILPGDMPLIQPATLRTVARELAQHPVVYAQYRGRRGHPVAFAGELFSELIQLSGDEGARRLVSRYPSFGVEVDDSGVLLDVDTPADLVVARATQASRDPPALT